MTPMSHQVKCPTCGQVYPLVALAIHIQTDHPERSLRKDNAS
jgi:adenine-specific DNA methylase